jgi:hypothetical protein
MAKIKVRESHSRVSQESSIFDKVEELVDLAGVDRSHPNTVYIRFLLLILLLLADLLKGQWLSG